MIIPIIMRIHLAVIFHTDIFPLAVPHFQILSIFSYFRPNFGNSGEIAYGGTARGKIICFSDAPGGDENFSLLCHGSSTTLNSNPFFPPKL